MSKQINSLGKILATGMIGLSSLLSGCGDESSLTANQKWGIENHTSINYSNVNTPTPTTIRSPRPTPTPVKYSFNLNEDSRIFNIKKDRLSNFYLSGKDMDGDGDLDALVGYTLEYTNYADGELHIIILENQTPQKNKPYQAENPSQ